MALQEREHFGSRRAVIFAMAGSAIGLGNIWRFPYIVGEHGGAAFIFFYAISTILISLPIFVSEVMIGRRSRHSAFSAMSTLQPGKSVWKFFGVLGIVIPTFIACYYSVVGGWSIGFLFKSLTGEFISSDTLEVQKSFSGFVSSQWLPVVFHLLFMAISAWIVAKGVNAGIAKFNEVVIPVLFVLIVLMSVYSLFLPGAEAGVRYLVEPDFMSLSPRDFAFAMGQSFYSLSIGTGIIITYGSYVDKKENILFSSGGTAVFDLCFAILAGFAIMPAVFAAGIEPSCGPGLIFKSIPFIFSTFGKDLPMVSYVASVAFFAAVVVAALTSLISLLEVGVSFAIEHLGISRLKASFLLSSLCGSVGCVCALSDKVFSLFDWVSSNILLPILAIAVVIIVGFAMKKEDVRDEFTNSEEKKVNGRLFPVAYFLIRWVAPVSIVVLLVSNFIL